MDTATTPRIRSRQIGEADLPRVAALLARGFSKKPAEFWAELLGCLSQRCAPSEMPRYGYLLEHGDTAVGAILLIFARVPGSSEIRCNVSSWFVEERFRSYASLLVSKALSHPGLTYLNITPAPRTLPIIKAQGFVQYSRGIFVAFPAVQSSPVRLRVSEVRDGEARGIEEFEQRALNEHNSFGCISLCCEGPEGTYPFVFRARRLRRVPCAQLIYCRDMDHMIRCAAPIGRFLLRRGLPFLLIDANGPIAGLAGRYFDGKMPKYFKGDDRPRLGDLSYTETAMFGM